MITLRVHTYESNLYSVGRVSVNCWSTVYRQTDDRFWGSCSSILPWRWGGRNLVNSGRGGEHRKQGISSMVLKDSQQRWHEKKATSAEFVNFCQPLLIICCSVLFCPQKIETLEHRMYTHPLHKDSSLESLYSLCEQKATVSLFRLCSLLLMYNIFYTSNGASFLPMSLIGYFMFANNVTGVLLDCSPTLFMERYMLATNVIRVPAVSM